MVCSRDTALQFADSLLLITVFLFQSVILNYLVINQFIQSSFTFLWFLGDFLCLLLFAFTLYVAYRTRWKERNGSLKGSLTFTNSRNSSRIGHRSVTSETSWPAALNCFSRISKTPFSYIAWIVYSCTIIAKVIVLFKAKTPPGDLKVDEFFGPQMLKISVGLSAIVFSLLVEAHYDGRGDPIRNTYIKTVSYGMALEILDSVSFLSLLIVKETHLLFTFEFENFILGLSSINLMLPAVALYKLTISEFGETYPLLIEILYKLLHLGLVNIPYLSVRIYLWQYYSFSDTSIFLVKNIYAIIALSRALIPDLRKLYIQFRNRRNAAARRPPHTNGNGVPLNGTPGSGSLRKKKGMEEMPMGLRTLKSRQSEEFIEESDKLRNTPSPHCSNQIPK